MQKLFSFLIIGLTFVVLNVSTVEGAHEAGHIQGTDDGSGDCGGVPCPTGDDPGAGEDCAAMPTPTEVAACWDRQAPPSGTSEAGAPPTLTLEDPRCQLAEADRDPGCPPMAPPMGDAAAKPSLGERVKSFFGIGTEDAAPPTGAPGGPPMGDPNMPPPVPADPMGTAVPPMGDPNMPPPVPADPMGTAVPPMDGPPPGEDCANKPTPEETAACWDQQGGHMDHPGGPPMGDPNMPPAGQ